MRTRYIGGMVGVVVLGMMAVLSAVQGQNPNPPPQNPPAPLPPTAVPTPPRPLPSSVQQASFNPAATTSTTTRSPGRDLSQLSPTAQQAYRSALSGADWLYRANLAGGRFLPGWIPDLNQPVESDSFLRQAGATWTFCRAARFFKEERFTARARQSVLTLLAETGPDPRDPHSRCTTLPSTMLNRLGTAGMLLAAIHELPDPAKDLLDQGEQIARFIFRQQQADGSFRLSDQAEEIVDPEGINQYPGMALYGLMRSNLLRPAPWKHEVARRALPYYRARWKDQPHAQFAVWQSAAASEAFLQSTDRARDAAFADFAFEMCDWLCTLQYERLDPRHPYWRGGFQDFEKGKPVGGQPRVGGAAYAMALAEGCRVTRQKPDAERFTRYRDACGLAMQFLGMLQYSEANTQHFAPEYRQLYLLGGFHGSFEDGGLRLEYSQFAVAALLQYLSAAHNL